MRLFLTLLTLALAINPLQCYAADADADHSGHDHSGHDHSGHDHSGHEAEKPPHGGILQEAAGNHLELVHNAAAGTLTLYVLDGKLQPLSISAKQLTAQVKAVGATTLMAVTLKPAAGDTASVFTGTAETLKTLTSADVILRVELDGKNQRVVFSLTPPATPPRTTPVVDEHGHDASDGHKH